MVKTLMEAMISFCHYCVLSQEDMESGKFSDLKEQEVELYFVHEL